MSAADTRAPVRLRDLATELGVPPATVLLRADQLIEERNRVAGLEGCRGYSVVQLGRASIGLTAPLADLVRQQAARR